MVEIDRPATHRLAIEPVLDIADEPAKRGTGPVDLRHNLARGGDLGDRTLGHEAILQIDHGMGGAPGIEAKDPEPAPRPATRSTTLGEESRLMHADAPFFSKLGRGMRETPCRKLDHSKLPTI
ncbi:MAG: hypothetical protein FWD12_03830 [Alphaproteobacteria bacterium]|nr:hypothetical protein [Alphaproteobacteria bacterium]